MVQNEDGYPGITSWWQGSSAGYFDYSRQEAASWWSDRVRRLQTDFGFDSFKFDAGETNWLPANFSFSHLPPSRQPNGYSESYVRNMESFGPIVEVRTGWKTQDVPIFTRMLDKSTVWTYENGLKTLIPTLLQFGIEGYPFVLPDMIGGNGYNVLRPEKELFVRWMQANVFMPALQFSYAPWDYDQEVRGPPCSPPLRISWCAHFSWPTIRLEFDALMHHRSRRINVSYDLETGALFITRDSSLVKIREKDFI